jgi:hypothetical protein
MSRGLILVLALWAAAAGAHDGGTSYSDWSIDGRAAQVRVRISQLELTRLQLDPYQMPDYADRVAQRLPEALELWSGAKRCRPGVAEVSPGADGWLAARWTLTCPAAHGHVIRSSLLHEVAPAHLHLARVTTAGAPPSEYLLTYAEPGATFAAPPAGLAAFVTLGIEHILTGWDHLAFLLALILLASRLAELALVVTAFTLAHSVTLAAAVLGWAAVDMVAVEALIGLSILIVAAENLWARSGRGAWLPLLLAGALALLAALDVAAVAPLALAGAALFVAAYFGLAADGAPPMRLRVAIAFVFGLVHGFGFAGVLAQLELPAERLALGLFGFNLGVELGQLLVVAGAWLLLRALARAPRAAGWVGDGASAAVCALGAFWFVGRAFG